MSSRTAGDATKRDNVPKKNQTLILCVLPEYVHHVHVSCLQKPGERVEHQTWVICKNISHLPSLLLEIGSYYVALDGLELTETYFGSPECWD